MELGAPPPGPATTRCGKFPVVACGREGYSISGILTAVASTHLVPDLRPSWVPSASASPLGEILLVVSSGEKEEEHRPLGEMGNLVSEVYQETLCYCAYTSVVTHFILGQE